MELTYPLAYSSEPGVTLMKATKPAPSVEEQMAAVGKHPAATSEPVKYVRAPDANGAAATSSRPPATQDNAR